MDTTNNLTPMHRWTWSALEAAKYFYNLLALFARTAEEVERCEDIRQAIDDHNLYAVLNAFHAARMQGTRRWRQELDLWAQLVFRHVLQDFGQTPEGAYHPSWMSMRFQ